MRLLPLGRDEMSFFKTLQSALRSSFVGVACVAVVLQPLTADLAMAQSITVDPTAPRANRAGVTRSSTGKPTINIVAPKAGVSLNRYKTLNTTSGAIFNNSTSGGKTKTGGTVSGNSNLKTAGTAKVIVNEVRGTARSTVKGSLEVFGAKADVIIANQNGITCDGCSFVNTGRATLSTGSVAVSGSNVNLNVKTGAVTVGRGGLTGADTAQLAGRHVIIDGKVTARDSIVASGGAQRFDARTGKSYAAPSDRARSAPYAVDATSFGSLQAGSIRVIGNESGLGVRLDGRMVAGRDAVVSSRGDVAVRNLTAKRDIYIGSSGNTQQTNGTIQAGNNLTVSARRFATSAGAKLVAGGVVTIKTSDTLTVGGEIRAKQIKVTTSNSTLNVGRVIASQELTIVAGEITNRRSVSQTNLTYYSGLNTKYIPWMKNYIQRNPRGWLSSYYTYLLNRSEKTVADQQTLGAYALMQAHNVSLTATKGNITNNSTITAGNLLTLKAKLDVINKAQEERDRQSNGSYKVTYHSAGIHSNSITINAGRNFTNSRAAMNVRHSLSITANNSLSTMRDYSLTGGLTLVSRQGTVTNTNTVKTAGSIYLAGRTGVTNSAALSSGYNATLYSSAGAVTNKHYISAKRDVTLKALGNVYNYSTVASRNALLESTRGNVTNKYRAYGYGTLTVNAYNDILHQGYASRDSYFYGGSDVSLTAGRNLTVRGARVWSNGDILLRSGDRTTGSVLITGLESRQNINKYSGSVRGTEVFTTGSTGAWRASTITAKGAVRLTAARGSLTVEGSNVAAGKYASLYAASTISIRGKDYSDAITTRTRKWYSYTKRSWFRRKTYWSYNDTVRYSGTKRYAGANVSAGTDLYLSSGSSFNYTGGLTYGRSLSLKSRNGSLTTSRDIASKGAVTLEGRTGVVVNSNVSAATNLNITSSAGGITNNRALRADGNITMTAYGNISNYDARARQHLTMNSTRGSVTNRYVAYGYNTLNVSAYNDIVNQGYASRHSYMYGGRGVTLAAGRNLTFNGARVWGYRDISLTAGNRTTGNVTLTGIASQTKTNTKTGAERGTEIWTTTTRNQWRGSIVDARGALGNLYIASNRGSVNVTGSDLIAGNAMTLAASDGVTLAEHKTYDRSDVLRRSWYSYTKRKWFRKKTYWSYRDTRSSSTIKTNLNSGSVTAKTLTFGRTPNVTLAGSTIKVNGSSDVQIAVWKNLNIKNSLYGRDISLYSETGTISNSGLIRGRNVSLVANATPSVAKTIWASLTGKDDYTITNTGRIEATSNAELIAKSGIKTNAVIANDVNIRSTNGSVLATGALLGGDSVNVDAYKDIQTAAVLADDVILLSRRGGIEITDFDADSGTDWATGKTTFANRMSAEIGSLVTTADVANRNQAIVHARANLTLDSYNSFDVRAGATVSAAEDLVINASNIRVLSTWTGTDLLRSAILAGGDLTLNARNEVRNTGGTISAKGNLYINAGTNIVNDGIKTTYVLTKELGCDGSACGKRDGFTWSPGELLAGQGMILTAGRSIYNRAGQIAAAGSILLHARDNILNEAKTGQFRLVDIYKKKKFLGITTSKTVRQENQAVVDSAVIQTEFGDITLITDRGDITNNGSFFSSGGDLTLQAGRDIKLNAISMEVHNLYQKKGFSGFLTYSSNKTYWNNFATALSQLEGMNVTLDAGNDVQGVGTTIMALNDLSINGGRDVSFDAKQNEKYLTEKGWSFGLTSSNFRLTQGIIQSGDVLQAYIDENPALAAVHELATARDGWGALNGTLATIWHGSQTLANANGVFKQLGGQTSLGGALAKQFIPKDFEDFEGLLSDCSAGSSLGTCAAAAGIGFRFEMWESRQEWTESHVARLGAGNDLTITAGRDIALVGGTIASAGRDALIVTGRDFLATAVADNTRTENSGWGLNIGVATNGVTVGGHANGAKSEQTIYTNATLTAGRDLDLVVGRDARFLGAVVKADNIYIDVTRDLTIASRQNTSSSSSWGFNASVTFNGGTVTGLSLGGSYGNGSRAYTDTPTWIEANQVLDIYVGRTTYLMGAVINSKNNKLVLDTGAFIFDDFRDHDRQVNVGGSISVGVASGSFQDLNGNFNATYRNKKGVTYATVGGGEVRVRSNPNINLNALNTDVGTVHRTTKNVYVNIKIPGINLKTLRENLEEAGNFIRAATADVPDHIRASGGASVSAYQRMIANGASREEAARVARGDDFRKLVETQSELDKAIARYGSIEAVPEALRIAILEGEAVLYANVDGVDVTRILVSCDLMGQRCEIALADYIRALENAPGRATQANADAIETFGDLFHSQVRNGRAHLATENNQMQALRAAFLELIICEPTEDLSRAEAMLSALNASPDLFAILLRDVDDQIDTTVVTEALAQYRAGGGAGQFEEMMDVAAAAATAQSKEEFHAKLLAIGEFAYSLTPIADGEELIRAVGSGNILGMFVAGAGFIPVAKLAKATGRTGTALLNFLRGGSRAAREAVEQVRLQEVAAIRRLSDTPGGAGSNGALGFYDPRAWRQNYEEFYNGNVTSTTVPPYSAKNVQLAGERHPRTGVVFDQRGYPVFDSHTAYDTRFTGTEFGEASYQTQMRMATRDLRSTIETNSQLRSQFSNLQIDAIASGQAKIPGYTWHHHQDTGRMQLVDETIHRRTGHIGGEAMSGGQ